MGTDPIFKKWGLSLLFFCTLGAAQAQKEEQRSLEVGGETLVYTLRTHPPDAHLLDAAAQLEPVTVLNASKLLNRHLSAGNIEEAALLSNSPRRRFEVLRDYQSSIGEDEFKRVFARYFYPENRLLAEVAIGRHRLLVWHLKTDNHYAGQYYVEVEGRFLIDDAPSEERSRLRRVLEAYRGGKIAN